MIQKPNFNNLKDVVKYLEEFSVDIEEETIHDLKDMFRKFPKRFNLLEIDLKKYNEKGEKEDKDFLYKELINPEEIRYSLLQKLKDTESLPQKKELEEKFLNLWIKVIYLRVIIIFYGKSEKMCEILVKEILENESQ